MIFYVPARTKSLMLRRQLAKSWVGRTFTRLMADRNKPKEERRKPLQFTNPLVQENRRPGVPAKPLPRAVKMPEAPVPGGTSVGGSRALGNI